MKPIAEEGTFDLSFTLIRVFLTVYETNSVKDTADRLGVSQPSVSQQLEKLRFIYGDELFCRRGGKMVPTSKARKLEKSFRTIVKVADGTFTQPDLSNEPSDLFLHVDGYCAHTIGPRLIDHFTSNNQYKLSIRNFDHSCPQFASSFANADALITSGFVPDLSDRFLLVERTEDPWVLVKNRPYSEVFRINRADDTKSLIIPTGLAWEKQCQFDIAAECPVETLPITIASTGIPGILPRSLAFTMKIYFDFIIEEAPSDIPPNYISLYTFDNERSVETLLEIVLMTMRNART